MQASLKLAFIRKLIRIITLHKMSLQHFFLENQDFGSEVEASADGSITLSLSSEDLHHAKVLRLKPGEHIGVIDSKQRYFRCEIVDFQKDLIVKNVTVTTGCLSQSAGREMTNTIRRNGF